MPQTAIRAMIAGVNPDLVLDALSLSARLLAKFAFGAMEVVGAEFDPEDKVNVGSGETEGAAGAVKFAGRAFPDTRGCCWFVGCSGTVIPQRCWHSDTPRTMLSGILGWCEYRPEGMWMEGLPLSLGMLLRQYRGHQAREIQYWEEGRKLYVRISSFFGPTRQILTPLCERLYTRIFVVESCHEGSGFYELVRKLIEVWIE